MWRRLRAQGYNRATVSQAVSIDLLIFCGPKTPTPTFNSPTSVPIMDAHNHSQTDILIFQNIAFIRTITLFHVV